MAVQLTNLLIYLLLTFGALLMLIAAIGVVRMPDLLLRSSAASKATTLGAAALLLATAFAFGDMGISSRMVAVIAFLFLTTPVATHMLARAATRCGVVLWPATVNELPKPLPVIETNETRPALGTD
ncbi:MAG: Na+/H+ antiporter subunit G [Caldilinea sp. CFX5]|nr:Na+/H+ antiporter subunit G [Caldilinea sp. CFX5]